MTGRRIGDGFESWLDRRPGHGKAVQDMTIHPDSDSVGCTPPLPYQIGVIWHKRVAAI